MKLNDAELGKKVVIKNVSLSATEKNRLTAFGIKDGAVVTPERLSAFKSSVLVRCGGVRVIMRAELAAEIEVDYV